MEYQEVELCFVCNFQGEIKKVKNSRRGYQKSISSTPAVWIFSGIAQCSEQPHGVKTAKKVLIDSTLCPFLKPSCHYFWENLPINDDSVELLMDRDQSEYVDDSC